MSTVRLLQLTCVACVAACATGGSGPVDATEIDMPPPVDASIDSSINACLSTDTCANTNVLGAVSGDTATPKLLATGYRAAWLRVRVTEDDSDIGGKLVRLKLRLTSPSTAMFDVIAYVNVGTDIMECVTTRGTATSNGNIDEVILDWGESGGANGNNDGRDVSIEIRPTSTSCTTSQLWSLEIEGNP